MANTRKKHWTSELEGADIVINLAGKSVNCRYTEKNKKEIFDSRVNATKALGEAVRNCTVPPKTMDQCRFCHHLPPCY